MKVQVFENFRAGLYSLGLGPEALQDKLWSHQDFPASNQNRITLLIIIQLLIHTLEGKHEISDAQNAGNVYRFKNIQMKQIILSRDIRWLNSFWKEYKKRRDDSKKLVDEFYSHEEDDQTQDESETEEPRENEIEETKDSGDGNNTEEQKKLGIDIQMIGAREEELGRTRSQTQEMMSPRNESMERAELTMEDWIHETCLFSAVTSGPTEPKTFQEAWHSPVEEERNNWQIAIRKEIKSMINRGVWRKIDKVKIPENRRLIGNKWVFKIKRDGTYRARLVALGYSQIPGVDYTDNFAPVAGDFVRFFHQPIK